MIPLVTACLSIMVIGLSLHFLIQSRLRLHRILEIQKTAQRYCDEGERLRAELDAKIDQVETLISQLENNR